MARSSRARNAVAHRAVVRCMRDRDIRAFREAKDEFFRTDHHSPIPNRSDFEGLAYFEPDRAFEFTTRLEPADGSEIQVQTSDGQLRTYRRSARAELDGPTGPFSVTLFTSEGREGFFVPFRDSTSGSETYGAGRYLDVEPNPDGTVTIDFNLAYNPYCAYDDAYSCPLPPPENWLTVRIEAGERNYPRTVPQEGERS